MIQDHISEEIVTARPYTVIMVCIDRTPKRDYGVRALQIAVDNHGYIERAEEQHSVALSFPSLTFDSSSIYVVAF